MKAIFLRDGVIDNIEINEACSSGCGSFIETFAHSLGYEVGEFAEKACRAQHPVDLGTRCTVFMNSKVKQAIYEANNVEDIAAGLAVSVIKNCFNKFLKIYDMSMLGNEVVVHGGAFKNNAVLKALEDHLGKEVVRPNMSELMGAYGAALYAKQKQAMKKSISNFIGFDRLETVDENDKDFINCKGCSNLCTVTQIKFRSGNVFYTGNSVN